MPRGPGIARAFFVRLPSRRGFEEYRNSVIRFAERTRARPLHEDHSRHCCPGRTGRLRRAGAQRRGCRRPGSDRTGRGPGPGLERVCPVDRRAAARPARTSRRTACGGKFRPRRRRRPLDGADHVGRGARRRRGRHARRRPCHRQSPPQRPQSDHLCDRYGERSLAVQLLESRRSQSGGDAERRGAAGEQPRAASCGRPPGGWPRKSCPAGPRIRPAARFSTTASTWRRAGRGALPRPGRIGRHLFFTSAR